MADLTMSKRKKMPKSSFAGGGPKGEKGFPINDAKHARLAISGASRSFNAGNISASEKSRIQGRARSKLRGMDGPAKFK